jgi:hypothetical protein
LRYNKENLFAKLTFIDTSSAKAKPMTAWKIFLIVCTVMFVAISVSAVFPVFAKIMTASPIAQSVQRQQTSGVQQSPSSQSESPRNPASQLNRGAYTSAG